MDIDWATAPHTPNPKVLPWQATDTQLNRQVVGYAIFAGTIKGRNQLYTTYEAFKDDPPAATPEGAEPSDETDGTGAWGTRSV